MGTNSFIDDSGQFHKVRFKDADRLRLPGADLWPFSRPCAETEGTPERPGPRVCGACYFPPGTPEGRNLLLSSWDPRGPEPQGSSCQGEGPGQRQVLAARAPRVGTPRRRMGQYGPHDHRPLLTRGPHPGL